MAKQNGRKPPKGSVRFSLSLSEEQKSAKQAILHHPYNFIVGKAGSGKTLLACQIALDLVQKKKKWNHGLYQLNLICVKFIINLLF